MKITEILRDSCPSGIDCDRIYDTGPDLAVLGRVVIDEHELGALGIRVGAGEAVVLIERRIASELVRKV